MVPTLNLAVMGICRSVSTSYRHYNPLFSWCSRTVSAVRHNHQHKGFSVCRSLKMRDDHISNEDWIVLEHLKNSYIENGEDSLLPEVKSMFGSTGIEISKLEQFLKRTNDFINAVNEECKSHLLGFSSINGGMFVQMRTYIICEEM